MEMLRGLALLVAITGAVQAGQVYRWTDAEGNVHFGDRPPAEAEQVPMRDSAPPGEVPDRGQREDKTRKLLNAWEEERRLKEERKAEAEKEQAMRERRCAKARNELYRLERGNRFYEIDSKGERSYWDEEKVRSRQQSWREEVERWCGS